MLKFVLWGTFHTHRSRVPVIVTLQRTSGHIHALAAGTKHISIVTTDGNIVLVGCNRFGQIGQPTDLPQFHNEFRPYTYEFEYSPGEDRLDSVACGCNYNIFYKKGSKFGVVLGSNIYGQLGLGHKLEIDAREGAPSWDPVESEFLSGDRTIDDVICGFNHTIFRMSDGSMWSCGANTFGELGFEENDSYDLCSPVNPRRIVYFEKRGIEITEVRAGNSWTLFKTKDGRVYGCGQIMSGQLTTWNRGPTVQALHRPTALSTVMGGARPLIRIAQIGCTADMAIYVSANGELFVKGSLPDIGYVAAQYSLIQIPTPTPLQCEGIVCGTSHALIYTKEKSLLGLGVTIEGQLGSKDIQLTDVVPFRTVELSKKWDIKEWRNHVAAGNGFTVMNAEVAPAEILEQSQTNISWPM